MTLLDLLHTVALLSLAISKSDSEHCSEMSNIFVIFSMLLFTCLNFQCNSYIFKALKSTFTKDKLKKEILDLSKDLERVGRTQSR